MLLWYLTCLDLLPQCLDLLLQCLPIHLGQLLFQQLDFTKHRGVHALAFFDDGLLLADFIFKEMDTHIQVGHRCKVIHLILNLLDLLLLRKGPRMRRQNLQHWAHARGNFRYRLWHGSRWPVRPLICRTDCLS